MGYAVEGVRERRTIAGLPRLDLPLPKCDHPPFRAFCLGESVIQRSTTILTLCVTLLHAGLGCCWHHAHADELATVSHEHADSAVDIVAQSCSHHNVCDAVSGGVHSEPTSKGEKQHPHDHDHGQCDQGQCVYMAGPRAELMPCDECWLSKIVPAASAILFAGTKAPTTSSVLDVCCSLRSDCALAPQWTQIWLI